MGRRALSRYHRSECAGSCFCSIMFHLCLTLTISFMLISCHKSVRSCLCPVLPPKIYWGFRSVDPHIRLRKKEGSRKRYKDSAWCQTKAKLLMEDDDDDDANGLCLREPDDSSGRDFSPWTLISSLSMIAPLTCMNNEQRFRQAHFLHADPWIARIWPFSTMRIY